MRKNNLIGTNSKSSEEEVSQPEETCMSGGKQVSQNLVRDKSDEREPPIVKREI